MFFHLLVNILTLLGLEASRLWEVVHILLLHQLVGSQGLQDTRLHLAGIPLHLEDTLEFLNLVGCQVFLEVM